MLTPPLGPLKMHSRRGANLSISSSHLHPASGLSSAGLSSGGLSPRFPPQSTRHLLASSGPPSPALPSLLPRHGKKPAIRSHNQLRRIIVTFGACLVLVWLATRALSGGSSARGQIGLAPDHGQEPMYEMVGDSSLPEEPSVAVLPDNKGRTRWIISIPPKSDFPLRPARYKELCSQAEEISTHVAMMLDGSQKKSKTLSRYYDVDPNFLDVPEAEAQGLLGYATGGSGSKGNGVCEKSLTYVMETGDAGMGASLMGLWLAYGLAQTEGRAFFVDDTRWPYGNYSTYFRPPPKQSCAQPPASHRLPCPHSAAHLLVSAATFDHTFGDAFFNSFSSLANRPYFGRETPIFQLARVGYEALFHLADNDDVNYLLERKRDVIQKSRTDGGRTVGMHVRRGDRHPWEFQYREDYLPIMEYMNEARQILIDLYEHDEAEEEHVENAAPAEGEAETPEPSSARAASTSFLKQMLPVKSARKAKRHGNAGFQASRILVASDDPEVYDKPQIARTFRAQDRIVLASKSQLERMQNEEQRKNKNRFLDEIHGWEGGFFRDVFWGLGQSEPAPAVEGAAAAVQEQPSEAALNLRAMVGRAYLLDLAVLAEADEVVCGVSAMGCRLLAVMLGEERVRTAHWRNIDGGFGWTGLAW